MQPFTQKAIKIIQKIPHGKVATYGQIAALAGDHRAARQISRVLHSMSSKHNLPWQRVINSKGLISLKRGHGYEGQRTLLEQEGVSFDLRGQINLSKYLWRP